jgi:hypothetical protein
MGIGASNEDLPGFQDLSDLVKGTRVWAVAKSSSCVFPIVNGCRGLGSRQGVGADESVMGDGGDVGIPPLAGCEHPDNSTMHAMIDVT